MSAQTRTERRIEGAQYEARKENRDDLGLWFLLPFFDGVAALSNVQQGMGGVAYFAHIGGFVTGLEITLLLRPWLQPPASVSYPYIPRHPDATSRSKWWQ